MSNDSFYYNYILMYYFFMYFWLYTFFRNTFIIQCISITFILQYMRVCNYYRVKDKLYQNSVLLYS